MNRKRERDKKRKKIRVMVRGMRKAGRRNKEGEKVVERERERNRIRVMAKERERASHETKREGGVREGWDDGETERSSERKKIVEVINVMLREKEIKRKTK